MSIVEKINRELRYTPFWLDAGESWEKTRRYTLFCENYSVAVSGHQLRHILRRAIELNEMLLDDFQQKFQGNFKAMLNFLANKSKEDRRHKVSKP